MGVGDASKASKEKTCINCVHFKTEESNIRKTKGTCYGHSVVATGSCNFFKKKE